MKHLLIMTCLLSGLASNAVQAQQTKPLPMEPLFQLNPTSVADRASQTREFHATHRQAVLEASASVLQDMGYSISGGQRELGLIFADKQAAVQSPGAAHTIAEAGLVTVTLIASLLAGQDMVTDLPEQVSQKIYLSLSITPASVQGAGSADAAQPLTAPGRVRVRLSLDRDMFYDNGRIITDHTELPLVNQEFFEKLHKSLYLHGESL